MEFMRQWLSFISEGSIIKLDLSELIDNTDMFRVITIDNVFNQMKGFEEEKIY